MQDILKLNLSGVKGKATPLVDIYVNGELFEENVKVTANTFRGQQDEVLLKGDFSDLESLSVRFKNDAGIERVDIHSVSFNGHAIDLSQGEMVRENGAVYEGQTKMYWNGNFTLDAAALKAGSYANAPVVETPATNAPTTQVIEFDLTSVRGHEAVHVYVNGELVEQNHVVKASMIFGQRETLKVEVDADKVDSVALEFFNDAGSTRVDVLGVRVNGHELDLEDGAMTRSNGAVYEGQNKMYWNGELSFKVPADYSNKAEAPVEQPAPVEETPVEETPVEETPTEQPPVDETPAEPEAETPAEPPVQEPVVVPATQKVAIELSSIQGSEKVDIYINGELVKAGHTVDARMIFGKSETVEFDITGSDVQSVAVAFTNDSGISRVDVRSIEVNGKTVDLDDGALTRSNGQVFDGQSKLYWNGEYSVKVPQSYNNEDTVIEQPDAGEQDPVVDLPDVPEVEEPEAEQPEPEQPEAEQPEVEEPEVEAPVAAAQKVALTMAGVQGSEAVNIYVNGSLLQNHTVTARMTAKQTDTVNFDYDGEVNSVEVEFVNDSGSSRVDIFSLRVNNNEVNLGEGSMVRTNGDTYAGQTKMYWNGKFSVDVPGEYNMAAEQPSGGSGSDTPSQENPQPDQPDQDKPDSGGDNGGGGSTPPAHSGGNVDWGVDPNLYRGDFAGRDRAERSDVEGGKTLHIETGTSAREISNMIKQADPHAPLTVEFAAGEHWFTEKLLVERGDITIKGAGEGKTVFVANFPDGKVDNLIQIQGDDIRLDAGSNNGRWRADQSDYVGTATKNFSLGDNQLTVSSTNGLSVGDHVMVYKQGTASKTDGDDEFGSILEISGINGKTLTFDHSLAFGSDMLARGQSLKDVKIYELDLLENVSVHDFSVRYHVTEDDLYNPYNMPVEDILNTTEFNFYPKYAAGGKTVGEASYGSHRAVVISGTHEANVYDVTLQDVGSHAFFFSGNLEMAADNLTVNGTYNKGVDGNGYGIEYDKTYYSDFTNLDITNVRHSVSANMLGGNGYNNFHVEFTDSNLDFHGGRDQANIYYIENMEYEAEWLPKLVNGKLTGDINYSGGKFQFELVEYRQDINAQENTVVWKNVSGNNAANNDGGVYDASGEKMAAYLSSNDDILVASDLGAKMDAGYGNDVLFSGKGDDLLTGGRTVGNAKHSDIFVFDKDNGNDTITDFEAAHDKIMVASDSYGSVGELLKHATQSGNDVILDFGNGNSLTLEDTSIKELGSGNIDIADSLSDFGM